MTRGAQGGVGCHGHDSISYIMAILFVVNLCNALSDFHGTSDGG